MHHQFKVFDANLYPILATDNPIGNFLKRHVHTGFDSNTHQAEINNSDELWFQEKRYYNGIIL